MVGSPGDVDATFLNEWLNLLGGRGQSLFYRDKGEDAFVRGYPEIGTFMAHPERPSPAVFVDEADGTVRKRYTRRLSAALRYRQESYTGQDSRPPPQCSCPKELRQFSIPSTLPRK